MKIRELFDQKTVFSFEVFPPKKTSSIDTVYKTLEELEGLTPDFISVTFSAGGSGNSALALDIASKIKESNAVEPMIHLPCINYSKEEISDVLTELDKRGIENILALRGDINPDIPPKKEFCYASDLVSFIRERGDYDIAGA
ncbi:MAG: methylenetetrahydrofolate reductase, partial [Lachnospiraceae bacterium]|nr:methylenetetrahydrofolate reductase [Lachnospiraceae bacterium]